MTLTQNCSWPFFVFMLHAQAGAIYVRGDLEIEECKFESNIASAEPSSNDIGIRDAALTCPSSCSNASGTCSAVGCFSFDTQQSCECFSCECAYPTAAPTDATPRPTAGPTLAPSLLPTPAPTQMPTPSPTPTTEVTVIPEGALNLFATKPGRATESFYLLNTNSETLQGTVALTRTSLPNTTNVTVVPATLSVPPGASVQVFVHVESEGLHPREHNLT